MECVGSDLGRYSEHCMFDKQKPVNFSTIVHRTKGTLDYIHFDLWSLSRVSLKDGAWYMLTFIDDFSKNVWVYMLKYKNEVFSQFKY